MLIKIKSFNQPFALGLRWLVASRDEIDYLKERENLSYGFVEKVEKKSPYRSAVLISNEYDKSVSLAGVLSQKYQDLILVHKIQNNNYWLCIIKDHKVWNELDLNGQTAGDYICSKKNAGKIIALAQEAFEKEGINAKEVTYATTQVQESFPELDTISLLELLDGCKKYCQKYKIAWLQSYKKKIKRLIIIASLLVLTIIGITYIYSSQNAVAREKARQLKIQMEKQQKARQKALYFKNLEAKIYQEHGNRSIDHVLKLINNLGMQSSGWEITKIHYDEKNTSQLQVSLKRTEFGDILSFRNAYQANTVSETISSNNENGSKLLDFNQKITIPAISKAETEVIKQTLLNKEPVERYKFISAAQKAKIQFKTSSVKKQPYGFMTSGYSVAGEGLWNLRKLSIIMRQFPTATIDTIDFTINDNKISWTTKGDIYD